MASNADRSWTESMNAIAEDARRSDGKFEYIILDDPEASVLSRYAETIQLQRQDFNGRLLTIRRDDLRVLAAVLGRRAEDLGRRLDELGLRAT